MEREGEQEREREIERERESEGDGEREKGRERYTITSFFLREGKSGKKYPNMSREAHMGRIISKLTAKLNLGLTLQVFKTSGGWIANFLTLGLKLKNH
jgi:hypothetical protein